MLNKEKLNANNVETAAHSDPQTNKTTKFDCRGGRLCPPANKQNGITLIALIITIIVMLILVGVTINVALNGNLFGKAETATRQTEEQAILEEMLAMMDVTNEGEIDYNTIIQKMTEKRGVENVKYVYPNASITGKLGTYNYIVSETEIRIGSSKSDVDEDLVTYNKEYKGEYVTLIFSDDTTLQYGGVNFPYQLGNKISLTQSSKYPNGEYTMIKIDSTNSGTYRVHMLMHEDGEFAIWSTGAFDEDVNEEYIEAYDNVDMLYLQN